MTLDLLYVNVKDAYKSTVLPPLGGSDHNLVHLSPTYTPAVKRMPVTTRTVECWSHEAKESLQCCLESTDWDVFCESLTTLTSVLIITYQAERFSIYLTINLGLTAN